MWKVLGRLRSELINEYGPEHYIICVKNEASFLEKYSDAGFWFLLGITPRKVAGDYASGTNHNPTNKWLYQTSIGGVT